MLVVNSACLFVCSVVYLPPLEPDFYLAVVAVLDPLSVDTQRFAPILQTLYAAFSIDLTIYLNPQPKLSQMPISRYVDMTCNKMPVGYTQCLPFITGAKPQSMITL